MLKKRPLVYLNQKKKEMALLNKQISKTLSWIIFIHVIISLAMIGYHVHAESNLGNNKDDDISVIDRIVSGPIHWTTMDKIVFAIIIMMGMELLGWITRNSGGT